MRALLHGNHGDCQPGLVGLALSELGFSFLWNEREFPREWHSLAGVDLVITLGSDWSINSDINSKEQNAEADLIRASLTRGVPILAICFGAQLVSRALGGTVSRSLTPEFGWHAVASTSYPEIFARDWFQWHYDVFTVPSCLEAVAGNGVGPQAMLSNRLLAVQFHPEVTTEIVGQWCRGTGKMELDALGIDPRELLELSSRQLQTCSVATSRMVKWFVNDVMTTKPFTALNQRRT